MTLASPSAPNVPPVLMEIAAETGFRNIIEGLFYFD